MNAVFLDRDGTIIEDRGYITVPDMVALLPGSAQAITDLRARGWKVVVVTNQAGVAKGLMGEADLQQVNLRMVAMLGAEGAVLDAIYCCPHHPEGSVPEYAVDCDCRKPRPGLLEQAAREHGFDLSRSVLIGDSLRDLQAARAAGTGAVLVLTGNGAKTAAQDHGADHVARDLADAAAWLSARRP
jgi:D-glycero-D-manno-heptose 1,7-bisphosphate phosphatase